MAVGVVRRVSKGCGLPSIPDGSSVVTRDTAGSRHVEYSSGFSDERVILLASIPWQMDFSRIFRLGATGAIPWMHSADYTYHTGHISPGLWMKSCHGWADHMMAPWQGVT